MSKKKGLGLFFFFWKGNLNLTSQSDLAKEGLEQSLYCTPQFAIVILFFFFGSVG